MKMLRVLKLFFLIVILTINSLRAQVGIGIKTPDPSAELHIYSTTKGFLPPILTNTQLNSISQPAEGLMVYCSDCDPKAYYLFNNNVWVSIMNGDEQSISRSSLAVTLEGGGSFQDSLLSEIQVDHYVSNNGYLTNQIDTDVSLSANSDVNIPSQKAVKFYVDSETTGLRETAVGSNNYHFNHENMGSITSGATSNMALGYNTLNALSAADHNVGLGHNSIKIAQNVPSYNTAVGNNTLLATDVGQFNAIMGLGAGENIGAGSFNALIGTGAGGSQNPTGGVFFGEKAGYDSQSKYNILLGYGAGFSENNYQQLYIENSTSTTPLIGGDFSVNRVGINIPISNLSSGAILQVGGSINLYNGSAVNEFSTDDLLTDNSDLIVPTEKAVKTYIDAIVDNILSYSTAGNLSGGNNYTPTQSLAKDYIDEKIFPGLLKSYESATSMHFGYNNMINVTSSADWNLAIGDSSLMSLTNGDYNIGIGHKSLYAKTSESGSLAIGYEAASESVTGGNSITIGAGAGKLNDGGNNVIIGANASVAATTGGSNVIIGKQAGGGSQSENSIFIGYQTAYLEDEDDRLYISNAYYSDPLIGGSFSSRVVTINTDIGVSNGFDFDVHAANKNYNLFVSGGAYKSTGGSTWNHSSDKRLKADIEYMQAEEVLDKVLKMKGVSYVWNDTLTGLERDEGIQYGFIAQDLQKVWPEKISKGPFGYFITSYGTYDAMFVECLRFLNTTLTDLETENKRLKEERKTKKQEKDQKLTELKARLKNLEILAQQNAFQEIQAAR